MIGRLAHGRGACARTIAQFGAGACDRDEGGHGLAQARLNAGVGKSEFRAGVRAQAVFGLLAQAHQHDALRANAWQIAQHQRGPRASAEFGLENCTDRTAAGAIDDIGRWAQDAVSENANRQRCGLDLCGGYLGVGAEFHDAACLRRIG